MTEHIKIERFLPALLGFVFLRRLFGQFTPTQPTDASTQDQRDAAARFTRGNIAIQAGVFVTEADLERQRAEVASIAFPK